MKKVNAQASTQNIDQTPFYIYNNKQRYIIEKVPDLFNNLLV